MGRKIGREARTGRFIAKEGTKSSGGESWVIYDRGGRKRESVLTSSSSAAALDSITTKHRKVLKKLAKD